MRHIRRSRTANRDTNRPHPGQPSSVGLVSPLNPTTGRAIVRDKYAGMNGTEKRRALELEAKQQAGQIREWAFEAESLKLADGSWYTPDFRVIHLDGIVEFEETKGQWREAARVRIKVAARLHPYRFTALRQRPKREGGGWAIESFGLAEAA